MESKAKLFGHAVHPILVVFPLGLLATAVIFDLVYLVSGNLTMATVGFWMIVSGIMGGLVASLFGWIDWFGIPQNTRAKRIGLLHGVGNVFVLVLFLGSWWLRRETASDAPPATALVLSFAGAGLALLTGWLGGELVERLGVAVDTGAHLDSPSSLSNRPATENATRN
ncbi:MAG TPA: DUF2231 domain-containing protein [Terriglobia bacterium]|jgi:uncharacterized membrane protein|nr:DUF2231 domain-containing protein [Terriglobia bacterium]